MCVCVFFQISWKLAHLLVLMKPWFGPQAWAWFSFNWTVTWLNMVQYVPNFTSLIRLSFWRHQHAIIQLLLLYLLQREINGIFYRVRYSCNCVEWIYLSCWQKWTLDLDDASMQSFWLFMERCFRGNTSFAMKPEEVFEARDTWTLTKLRTSTKRGEICDLYWVSFWQNGILCPLQIFCEESLTVRFTSKYEIGQAHVYCPN